MRCIIATVVVLFAAAAHAAADSPKASGRLEGKPFLFPEKGIADGVKVEDVDWDTKDGRYRVRLQGEWIIVPEAALVVEPNRFGPAVVWPYLDVEGTTQIRCFLPGAGA